MESNIKKYSLEDFPQLIQIVCNSIPKDNPNESILRSYCQIIYDLSETRNIELLLNFSDNNDSEDYDLLTKAIMYECLYIIYSNFDNLDAQTFLKVLDSVM